MLGQPLPNRLYGNLDTGYAHQIRDQKRLRFDGVGQGKTQFHIAQGLIALSRRQFRASFQVQPLHGLLDLAQMRQQNHPGVIQVINYRETRILPAAGGAKFREHRRVGFHAFQNGRRRRRARGKIGFIRPEVLAALQRAIFQRGGSLLPCHQIRKMPVPVVFREVDIIGSTAVEIVCKYWRIAGAGLKKRFKKRRRREILFIRHRFWNVSAEIQRQSARGGGIAILVPGVPPSPVLLAIKQSQDRHGPGQHNQNSPNPAPTAQPAGSSDNSAALPH